MWRDFWKGFKDGSVMVVLGIMVIIILAVSCAGFWLIFSFIVFH